MTSDISFEVDSSEPLEFTRSERPSPEIFAGCPCFRFEFSSRGDRVPGRLFLPPADVASGGPVPVVMLQHGFNGSKEADYMDAAALWVRGGAAVASIDLPLHGERWSAKLSERLAAGIVAGDARDPLGELLWTEFARQAVMDLQRCADVVTRLPEVDAKRLAFAGFSLGAIVGAVYCAIDSRPLAAALALAGGGIGPEQTDPCGFVGKIAPRPLLFVNAKDDELVSREATQALFDAASEPKQIEWFDAQHSNLPGVGLKAMWTFLREQLSIA
jgi:dienelactone hydrolase